MQALYYAAMAYAAMTGAIGWEPSLDSALARARQEGKPAFVLYVFGRLDEKFT